MPPRRRNAIQNAKKPALPTRRSARRTATEASAATPDARLPDVYNEMLVEAYENNPSDFVPSPRPTKRRRVEPFPSPKVELVSAVEDGQLDTEIPSPAVSSKRSPTPPIVEPEKARLQRQIVSNDDIDDSDDDEDDSDLEFEDVQITSHNENLHDASDTKRSDQESLQLDLSAPVITPRRTVQRRKPVSKAEREFRLNVHKWHLCCLLVHVATRSRWADDESVQRRLKKLISRKTIKLLHLDQQKPDLTQAERKFAFERGIVAVCEVWRSQWVVSGRGMKRAIWRENLNMSKELDEAEDAVDFEDFTNASKTCKGSRDLGAQLCCALLRSLAVEARLVCSMQVLPFSRVAKGETPVKAGPSYIQAGSQNFGTGPNAGTSTTTPRRKNKKIEESAYPIFWVEVLDPSISQWFPIDAIVRNTINKPRTGFEPPSSDQLNNMSYVVGFDDDGTAKDVTRRYTSAYNAKTRKTRVESTKYGAEWYNNALNVFQRHGSNLTDQVENAELDRRVAMEGMPKNVQDFKDHPVYVLERHLRHNEVIHPKRESGKFSVGTGKNQKVESVYRRGDVHACRSAEGWYRRGQDVKVGEQALKRVVPKQKREMSVQLDTFDNDDGQDEEREGVPLYAEFQTDLYVPPPVTAGRVPRNGYGNLDVYVSSMIPAGGVHLKHSLAASAAKVLKIDAVEAVTGFKFKGRQGTAVVDGVVIDAKYTAAMKSTIEALEDQLEEEVTVQRMGIMLGVWKKMLSVLRVRQRIEDDYGGTKSTKRKPGLASMSSDEMDGDADEFNYEDEEEAGGFVPDAVGAPTKASRDEEAANLAVLKERAPIDLPSLVVRQQVRVTRSPHMLNHPDSKEVRMASEDDLFGDDDEEVQGLDGLTADQPEEAGGFIVDEDQGGGFLPEADVEEGGGFVPDHIGEDQAGGFMPENSGSGVDDGEAGGGGGFIPDDNEEEPLVRLNNLKPEISDRIVRRSPRHQAVLMKDDDNASGGFLVEDDTAQRHSQPDDRVQDHSGPILLAPKNGPDIPGNASRKRQASPINSPGRLRVSSSPHTKKKSHPALSTQDSNISTRSLRSSKGKQTVVLERQETGSESDFSMPSHDPDEDDAEPQWVEDAFADDL